MIKVGIDAVDIDDLTIGTHYRKAHLEKVFTNQEINYCLSATI